MKRALRLWGWDRVAEDVNTLVLGDEMSIHLQCYKKRLSTAGATVGLQDVFAMDVFESQNA